MLVFFVKNLPLSAKVVVLRSFINPRIVEP